MPEVFGTMEITEVSTSERNVVTVSKARSTLFWGAVFQNN
jgi:hypothetical protein